MQISNIKYQNVIQKSKSIKNFAFYFVILIFAFCILNFSNVFAADFSLKIPQYQEEKAGASLVDFLQWAFVVAVASAGILALLMIMIGGFQYITAGGNEARAGNAKSRIQNAIIGLILALCSYLILNTINPDLVHPSLPGLKTINPTIILGHGKGTNSAGQLCLQQSPFSPDCQIDCSCEGIDIASYVTSLGLSNEQQAEYMKQIDKATGGNLTKIGLCKVPTAEDIKAGQRDGKMLKGHECTKTEECFDPRLVCRLTYKIEGENKTEMHICDFAGPGFCDDKEDCGKGLYCVQKQCVNENWCHEQYITEKQKKDIYQTRYNPEQLCNSITGCKWNGMGFWKGAKCMPIDYDTQSAQDKAKTDCEKQKGYFVGGQIDETKTCEDYCQGKSGIKSNADSCCICKLDEEKEKLASDLCKSEYEKYKRFVNPDHPERARYWFIADYLTDDACYQYWQTSPYTDDWDKSKTKNIPKAALPKEKDGIDLTGFIEKCCIFLESPFPIEEIIK